jgi:hypothetical protein
MNILKKIAFVMLSFILMANGTVNSLPTDKINILKWAYLVSLPLFYGYSAFNAAVGISKPMPIKEKIIISKSLEEILKKPTKAENKEDLIKYLEQVYTELNKDGTKNPEALNTKEIKKDSESKSSFKCLLCSLKKCDTYILLTYGSLINLAYKIIERDPGTIIGDTCWPIANAALMYCAGGTIQKQITDYLLAN